MLYAVYLMVQQPLVKTINPIKVTFWTMTFGVIPVTAVSAIEFAVVGPSVFDALVGSRALIVWIAILYYGLVATTLTWPIAALAVKHTNPTIVSAFGPVQVRHIVGR